MKNRKLMIETLELCHKLIGTCVETIKEMSAEIDSVERDYKNMADYAMKQKADNLRLDQKLTNILHGMPTERG